MARWMHTFLLDFLNSIFLSIQSALFSACRRRKMRNVYARVVDVKRTRVQLVVNILQQHIGARYVLAHVKVLHG